MATIGKSGGRLRAALLSSVDHRPKVRQKIAELMPVILDHVDVVHEDLSSTKEWHHRNVDIAIVMGGDGSILRSAGLMGANQRPVLGVNFGRLGFLAHICPDHLNDVFLEIADHKYYLIDHLMIKVSIFRENQLIQESIGLNELAIRAGAPYAMQTIDLYVDRHHATTYNCDGLIISTPVGSTAHNLSAGGPILRKDLQAIILSPLSPHTLTMRPVVDTADRLYEMVLSGSGCSAAAVLDGQLLTPLQEGDRIRVERAERPFQMIEVRGHDYYATLQDKLGWGGDLFRSNSARTCLPDIKDPDE